MTKEEFIERKILTASERLAEWIENNPDADEEKAAAELFDILMGKRDQ